MKMISNPLEILTTEALEKIYQGSLEVLAEVGVLFEDDLLVRELRERDCLVCEKTKRVKFPPRLVETCLTLCPNTFSVRARNDKYNLYFDNAHLYCASHSAPHLIEPWQQKQRKPELKDIRDMVTLIDKLENIHALLTPTGELADKPTAISPEWVFAEIFRNTEKPTVGPSFRDCPKWIIKMAEIVGCQIIGVTSCTPPLFYPKQDTDALRLYAKNGHPVTVGSGLALGGTGPVTLAGGLVQQLAETLAGIVVVQLLYPGTGILCLSETAPIDMRVGNLAWGGSEVALFHCAFAQISRHLGLKTFFLFPMSSAMIPDQQVGYEKAMQTLTLILSGVNFICGAGGIYNESTTCLEQLVIDNDIYGMVNHFTEGITVNDHTLAINVIKEVGLQRSTYLKHTHTRTWFKQEYHFPFVSNRFPYPTWESKGSKDIIKIAGEKAREIIRNHRPSPLPELVERELANLLKAVEKERLPTTPKVVKRSFP